jgi:DNA-binding winged helix-turn-helix (wHTH) protein/energy-coupling factor transporter ATP-binding protein EcfA2
MAQRTERSRFRIGELLVHPDRNVVVRDDKDIRLEPMLMQMLVCIAESRGNVISTQQIMREVWRHSDLDNSAVHPLISKLRKLLGDHSRTPLYLENIHGKGYRLVAPVAFPGDYLSSRANPCTWKGNPYVGLESFDDTHAEVFFGRADAVEKVIVAMRAQFENGQRFVLLVGASGSGKTSLLNAGVIPKLTPKGGENGLRALSVARCDLGAATDSDTLCALAGAIAGWTVEDRPVLPPQPVASLKELLVESPGSIHTSIDEAFRRHAARPGLETQAHLLLVLDHSEALVAVRDRDSPSEQQTASAKALAEFVRALETLCDQGFRKGHPEAVRGGSSGPAARSSRGRRGSGKDLPLRPLPESVMTDSPVSPLPVVLCALLDDARPQSSPSPADAAALAEPAGNPLPALSAPTAPAAPPAGVVIPWPGPTPPADPRGRIRLNGALLRRLRIGKLLSQQDLVYAFEDANIRISIATLKRVESPRGTMVRFRIAREFARYYDVPVETLLLRDP